MSECSKSLVGFKSLYFVKKSPAPWLQRPLQPIVCLVSSGSGVVAQPHQLRLGESNITVTGQSPSCLQYSFLGSSKGFSHWAFSLGVGQLGLQFDLT